MPAPTITVEVQPINIKVNAPPRAAVNVRPSTAAPIVPARPATGAAGPRVQVVSPNAVPQGLRNAAVPTVGSRILGVSGRVLGVAGRVLGVGAGVVSAIYEAKEWISPPSAGQGSDMIGGKPFGSSAPAQPINDPRDTGTWQPPSSARKPFGDPRTANRQQTSTSAEPIRKPLGDPRQPYRPTESPKPAPFNPNNIKSPEPRSRPGLGELVDAPIRSPKPVNTDSPFDLTTVELDRYGGVNLTYPIAQALKGLGIEMKTLKDGEINFDPLLTGISKLLEPIPSEISKVILPEIDKLLAPIPGKTATPILESLTETPKITAEQIGRNIAPVMLGVGVVFNAISAMGSNIQNSLSNAKISTSVKLPVAVSMGAQLPVGVSMGAQLPVAASMGAQLPVAASMGAQLPVAVSMGAQLPVAVSMGAQLPVAASMGALLPQTLTLSAPLIVPTGDISQGIANLEQTVIKVNEDTKTEIKRCNDINKNHCKKVDEKLDKIKKKQKEQDDDDDRRNPLIHGSGEIECDDDKIPYVYKGEGLNGLWQAVDIILNLNKQILIKICNLEEDTPTLQGAIAVECDGDTLSYGYSGPGFIGLQSQIQQLSNLNGLILRKVCDLDNGEEYPMLRGSFAVECDDDTLNYGYSGPGFIGLESQIRELSKLNSLILSKVCDIDVDIEYPILQGGGSYVCDDDTLNYGYSGPGFIGLQSQIHQLSNLAGVILRKVCDIDVDIEYPILQGGGSYVCDDDTLNYGYSGPGFIGLQSQIHELSRLNALILKKVCDIDVDISYPTLQGGGAYVCGDDTLSYGYSGPGFYGLQSQINEVLKLNAKILEEVCDLDDEDNPTLMGGVSVECGDDTLFYNYSGVGLIGLSDQISRLTQMNAKILEEVCDVPDITGQIEYFNCDKETQTLLYSGNGFSGLSSQVQALTALVKEVLVSACDTTCVPLMPDSRFEEFNVTRQLVISWGQNYPTQKGSLWHTSIPMPKDDLNWCDHFENLFIRKGEVCGRLYWENSKIWTGAYFESDDEARRVLRQLANLSDATPRMKDGDIHPRITNGGAVKRKPAERTVRAVRAVIASIDERGEPTDLGCFVPPLEGC